MEITSRHGMAPKATGITLIELMFVLAIMGILIALAYPSYVEYVRKGKRGDAQHLLMNWAVNQEIFRSNNPSYAADDNANLPAPQLDNYDFDAPVVTTTSYTLRATATGDQEKDKARDDSPCKVLTISHTGVKGTYPICWE